jgi:Tfp pilus assembly protein PilF
VDAMAQSLTYFSLLGVSPNATQDELEGRCRDLLGFLSSDDVPAGLREWAEGQAAPVDEAYAVLLDPEERTETKPAPRKATKPREEPAWPTPRKARMVAGARPTPYQRMRRNPLVLGTVIGLLVVAAVFVGRSGLPNDGDSSTGAAAVQEEGVLVPLDTKRVNELLLAAQKDPTNVDVLFELGESFFLAGQWQPAIDWFTKFTAIDGTNVHARTDIGTALFNLNRPAEAKATWLAAIEIAPNDPQLHYNLGFLYANSEPRDMAAATREWRKVVEVAPDSNLAKTAQVHLSGLASTP